MTPQDFKDWRDAMGFKTQQQAADALGLSVETIQNYERGVRRDGKTAPIPYTVALACSALFNRQKPWGG